MKAFLRVFCFSISAFLAFGAFAPAGAQEIPEDLEISLYSAPVMPGAQPGPMEAVIKPDGSAVIIRDRGQNEKETKTISLREGALERIWAALEANDFSSLQVLYDDPEVMDGDWAKITVTYDNQTHWVRTRNIRVTAFDNISRAINAELPEADQVKYNALLGADYIEVER